MVTGSHIAETCTTSGLLGTPYSKLDCQALVEKVLALAGMKIINYRGSNHMWRELVFDREKTDDAVILPGMLAFIVKQDGGEKKRGYHDGMGNATHVAIALGSGKVFESTTGGVQVGSIKRFTHVARIKDVDYDEHDDGDDWSPATSPSVKIDMIKSLLVQIMTELEALRDEFDN